MTSTYSNLAFDTLGYVKILVTHGMDRERAETLAIASRDCVMGHLTMEELSQITVEIIRQEPEAIAALTRDYVGKQ